MGRFVQFRPIFLSAAMLVAAWVLAVVAPAPSSAHIVTETPWHPLAAAYRTMMFFGDLKPVPWSKISTAFTDSNPAAYGTKSAQQSLLDIDPELGNAATQQITRAIDAEDRDALYAATTRAVSAAIRKHLKIARSTLTDPSVSARHVSQARDIYRAVGDFVRQADPSGFRTLGRAWLTLTSASGSPGIAGKGVSAADRAEFDAASRRIDDYLIANFEPSSFTPRDRLTPLPENVVKAKGHVAVAPWLPPGSKITNQTPLPKLVLNFEKQGVEESDLPMIAYGDMLFDSPVIFGDPARSLGITCSSCHNRSDINQSFFIPGISHQAGAADVDGEFFNPRFNDRRNDSLDIPTLRGLRYTAPYGRDGRFASLREFTRNVIVNEFGGAEPTPFMLDALVAYMLEFDFLPNAKITGDGRLTNAASEAARRGETLFNRPFAEMQGKACSSCHIPSANFVDRLSHDIGSQTGTYQGSHSAAYDTPTLLGTRFTAPYFHDGALPTLASVVDWFNLRYGLGLSTQDRSDLTAYLEAVGDADEPYEIYKGRHTAFRLSFEELTTFASTLDTLLPTRDTFHAKLMVDTVAADLALDASGMTNLPAKSKVYELVSVLNKAGIAIDAGAWKQAEKHWSDFKALQEKYDAALY